MAITTLPYPNMDFVPLDVLTADELDQIVANIDAINNASIPTDSIANSAITTAKLADDSVTSDKIDWTALSVYGRATNTVALTTANQNVLSVSLANFSESDVLQVTVTATASGTNEGNGLWIAFGGVSFAQVTNWGRTLTATEYFTKSELGSTLTVVARKDAPYALTLSRVVAIVRKIA